MTDIDTHIVIPAEHPSLVGHFPGNPIVPGVVLLEEVLQASRRALATPVELATIVSTKFLQAVAPGTSIDVSIKISTEPSGGHLKARFTGRDHGAPVFEGSLLLRTPNLGDT